MEKKYTIAEPNITCPKCGNQDIDSWEHKADSGNDECECGAKFTWERTYDITYDTELIEEDITTPPTI